MQSIRLHKIPANIRLLSVIIDDLQPLILPRSKPLNKRDRGFSKLQLRKLDSRTDRQRSDTQSKCVSVTIRSCLQPNEN